MSYVYPIHDDLYEQYGDHTSHTLHVFHTLHASDALSHTSYACVHLYKERERNHQRESKSQKINQSNKLAHMRSILSFKIEGTRVQRRNSAEKRFIFAIEHWNFGKILYPQYKACSYHILLLLKSYTVSISCLSSSLSLVRSPNEPYKVLLKIPLTLVSVTSPHEPQLPRQRINPLSPYWGGKKPLRRIYCFFEHCIICLAHATTRRPWSSNGYAMGDLCTIWINVRESAHSQWVFGGHG